MMDEAAIQRTVTQALNQAYEEPWGAYPATTRDNVEYVELRNEETGERFVVTIQKGM
jgi:hypothetical protein